MVMKILIKDMDYKFSAYREESVRRRGRRYASLTINKKYKII